MNKAYANFAAEKAIELLNIDSPSGFTKKATEWVAREFSELGFKTTITNKGAVLIDLGGRESGDGAVLFAAHTDTLGGMISEIKYKLFRYVPTNKRVRFF